MPPTAKLRPVAANVRQGPRQYSDTVSVPGGHMDSVPDEALLSAVLAMAAPNVDAETLAFRLLSGRRSIDEAVSGIVTGGMGAGELTPHAILTLRAVMELAARLVRPSLARHPVFVEHDALVTYCRLRAASARVQMVRLLFLDERKHMIADEVHQSGTENDVAIYIREIVHRTLLSGAHGLVVAHSAPSDAPPRPGDARNVCSDLMRAGTVLGIELLEYLLIGRQSYRCLIQDEGGKVMGKGHTSG